MKLSLLCRRKRYQAMRHKMRLGSVHPNTVTQIELFDRKGATWNAYILNGSIHSAFRLLCEQLDMWLFEAAVQ
jgi:hypothetical protein